MDREGRRDMDAASLAILTKAQPGQRIIVETESERMEVRFDQWCNPSDGRPAYLLFVRDENYQVLTDRNIVSVKAAPRIRMEMK